MTDSSNNEVDPKHLANQLVVVLKNPKLLAKVISALDPAYKNTFGYFISKHRFDRDDDDDYIDSYKEYQKLPDRIDQRSIEKLGNIFTKYGKLTSIKHRGLNDKFAKFNDPEISAIQQHWGKLESLIYEVDDDGKPDHSRLKKLEDLDIEIRDQIEYYYKNLQKGIAHKNQLLQRADYELHNHKFGLLDVLTGKPLDKSWWSGLWNEIKYSWNVAQNLKRPNRSLNKLPGNDVKFKSYEDRVSEARQYYIKDIASVVEASNVQPTQSEVKVESIEQASNVQPTQSETKVESIEQTSNVHPTQSQYGIDLVDNRQDVNTIDDVISEIKIINGHLIQISKNTKKLEEINKGVGVFVKKIKNATFKEQVRAFMGEDVDGGGNNSDNASGGDLAFIGRGKNKSNHRPKPRVKKKFTSRMSGLLKNPFVRKAALPVAAVTALVGGGTYAYNKFGNNNDQQPLPTDPDQTDSNNNSMVGGFLGSAVAPAVGQILGRVALGRIGGAIGMIGGPIGFAVGSIAGELIASNWDKIADTTSKVLETATSALSSEVKSKNSTDVSQIYVQPTDTNSELFEDAEQQTLFDMEQNDAVRKSAEIVAESVSKIENSNNTSSNQTANNVNIGGNTTVVNQNIRNNGENRRVNGTDRFTFVSPSGCVFTGTDY